MDDQELWQRLQGDDVQACADLYRHYSERVFRHLLQRVESRLDAEDLTAEVFIVAWNRRSSIRLDAVAGMLPWLLVTANLLLRNQQRSISRARRAFARVPVNEVEPDPSEEVIDSDADQESVRIIRKVLGELPRQDREIIQLCIFQEFSPQTVADLTGQRPGTVRSRLSRALSRLRTICAEEALPLRFTETGNNHA